ETSRILTAKIILIMKPALLGILQDLIAEMTGQGRPSRKANYINSQSLTRVLPQNFIEQMLPLVLHNLMGAPCRDCIPINITAIAWATLVVGGIGVQVGKFPNIAVQARIIAGAIKSK